MTEPIKHITIVGGGTAGWMSAAYLMIHLNRRALNQQVEVTVIESPNVPTVGVGEATVPAMMQWLQYLGIEEADFVKRCNASFKLGVRFVHWDKDPKTGAAPELFESVRRHRRRHLGLQPRLPFPSFRTRREDRTHFGDYQSPMHDLIQQLSRPQDAGFRARATSARSTTPITWMPAGSQASCRKSPIACGVEHVLDDVDDIELDERGFVSALQLREAWPPSRWNSLSTAPDSKA